MEEEQPKSIWIDVTCPGCGNEHRFESPGKPRHLKFKCKKCKTNFSVTYDTGQDELERMFRLAEDECNLI